MKSISGYVLTGWWSDFMGLGVLDYVESKEHSEYSSKSKIATKLHINKIVPNIPKELKQ